MSGVGTPYRWNELSKQEQLEYRLDFLSDEFKWLKTGLRTKSTRAYVLIGFCWLVLMTGYISTCWLEQQTKRELGKYQLCQESKSDSQ